MLSRREALRRVALVTVAVAGGVYYKPATAGLFDIGEGPAYEPWNEWSGTPEEGPLRAVRAGILAASAHNTQPWLFRVAPDTIEIYADLSRHLGPVDPYRREMFISLGCCIENVVLAAATLGYQVRISIMEGRLDLLPSTDKPELVARVELRPGKPGQSTFYKAIPSRRTHRGPYDPSQKLLPSETLVIENMTSAFDPLKITLFVPEIARERIAGLVVDATERIISDKEMIAASQAWERFSRSEVEKHRDGLTLDALNLPKFKAVLARILPAPSPEQAAAYWLDMTREVHVPTAAAFGIISVRNPLDRMEAVLVGRLWERFHLYATTRGIAVQPLNQPIEVADRERSQGLEPQFGKRIQQLSLPGLSPVFMFRLGRTEEPPGISPRRPLEAVLLS